MRRNGSGVATTTDSSLDHGTSGGQRRAAPDGYTPLRELTDLTLLGHWAPLEDGMSPCAPERVVSAMAQRRSLGDRDAEIWLGLHARALAGDPESQRTFGRVCENGLYRATADVQRAFFWYYRAGLQGHREARRDAERLMRVARIGSATMADPVLVYPGQWRITAYLADEFVSTSVFDLAGDGSIHGTLIRYGAPAPGGSDASEPGRDICPASPVLARYRGGWAYDGYGNVLTVVFESDDDAGTRHWRSDNWQIAITACRPGALFGHDRRMIGYSLECREAWKP